MLKAAIAASDFTARRLAKRLRMDETRLSKIVNRHVLPTPKECARIANALDRPVHDLFPSEAA